MQIRSSRTSINKILINSKIFKTIKVKDNSKGLSQIQKYLSGLKNSLKLLDQSKSSDKKNQKNSLHHSNSVLVKNVNGEEKLNNDYVSVNKSNRSEIIHEDNKNNIKLKIKSRLYTDKLSLLKEKNRKILNKKMKNKTFQEKNNNKVFVTSFNFPKVKEKNNKQGIDISEFNKINNNSNLSRNRDFRYSLPKIESRSTSGENTFESINSRNRIKSHIIKTSNSFSIKSNSNKSLTQEDKSSNINLNTSNDQNPINIINKTKPKDNIHSLNKKLSSLFGHDFKHSKPSSPTISNFVKRLKDLKLSINKKNSEHDLAKWIMSSKMKYVKWKLGANDLEKYFMSPDEYIIKEKSDSELRKTFYKKLDILVEDLKEEQEIRILKERENIYDINMNKEEKKQIKNNSYWLDEKAMNLLKEQSHFLKIIKKRKIKEQKNRDLINNILIRCKQRAFNINNS